MLYVSALMDAHSTRHLNRSGKRLVQKNRLEGWLTRTMDRRNITNAQIAYTYTDVV